MFLYRCRYDADFNSFRLRYDSADRIYTDLDRILCVLDGKPFDNCSTVGAALSRAFDHKYHSISDQVTESEYFDIRFYKKGTVHLKWKREDLWEAFNKTAAAGKKWLWEDTQQMPTEEAPRETGVVLLAQRPHVCGWCLNRLRRSRDGRSGSGGM